MNFKNKRPRKSRAGCKMCKPWKALGNSKTCKHVSELRAAEKFNGEIA